MELEFNSRSYELTSSLTKKIKKSKRANGMKIFYELTELGKCKPFGQ